MKRAVKTLGAATAAALALAVTMVGVSAADPARQGPVARPADAGGSLRLASSAEATALFDASNLAPGDAVRGTAKIANSGDASGRFWLSTAALSDSPGPGGGVLSRRLELKVEDLTRPESPVTLYRGSVGSMPALSLGQLPPGAARTYRLTVRFRDGGTPASATSGDNAYQGSSLEVAYVWNGE